MKKELTDLLDSVVHILDHYEEYGTITDEIMCNLEDSYDAYSTATSVNDAEFVIHQKAFERHYESMNNDKVPYVELMDKIEQIANDIKLHSEGAPLYVLSCDPDFAEKLNEVMSAQVNDSV